MTTLTLASLMALLSTGAAATPRSVRQSPLDGARVILDGGNDSLVVRDLAGGPVQPIAAGSPKVYEAAWAPDGSRIAFSGKVGKRTGVFVVPARRTVPPAKARLVVDVSALHLSEAASWGSVDWSADGRVLSFDVNDPDVRHLTEIYRVSADGTRLRRLVQVSPRIGRRPWVVNGGFSPDGRDLLYVQWPQMGRLENGVGPATMKSVPARGGDARTLVVGRRNSTDQYMTDANWSPDGKLIAYVNSCWPGESSGDCRPAVVDRRAGERQLMPAVGLQRLPAVWSGLGYAWRPLAGTIVYTYGRSSDTDAATSAAIYELSPATRKVRLAANIPCPWRGCMAHDSADHGRQFRRRLRSDHSRVRATATRTGDDGARLSARPEGRDATEDCPPHEPATRPPVLQPVGRLPPLT